MTPKMSRYLENDDLDEILGNLSDDTTVDLGKAIRISLMDLEDSFARHFPGCHPAADGDKALDVALEAVLSDLTKGAELEGWKVLEVFKEHSRAAVKALDNAIEGYIEAVAEDSPKLHKRAEELAYPHYGRGADSSSAVLLSVPLHEAVDGCLPEEPGTVACPVCGGPVTVQDTGLLCSRCRRQLKLSVDE